ncbi:MAG: S1-C subfamily serine protease [Bacteroidia bacterium]|jgi:S1-C subfamily serine protease
MPWLSIQVPESEMKMTYLKNKNLIYAGGRKLKYSLLKTSISPKESIENENKKIRSYGSGFAITESGLVATNAHVIEGGQRIHIIGINGDPDLKSEAEVLVKDEKTDLAILKITDKSFSSISQIPYDILDSDIKMGTEVFSIGFPKPSKFGKDKITTDGIISSVSNDIK